MMEAPKESLTTQKILERRKRFQKTGDFAAAAPVSASSSIGGSSGGGGGSGAAAPGFTKEQLAKREKLLALIAKNKASSAGGAAKPKPKPTSNHGHGFGWRNAWTPSKQQAKQALSDSLPTTP
jgi:hypothetical protein